MISEGLESRLGRLSGGSGKKGEGKIWQRSGKRVKKGGKADA